MKKIDSMILAVAAVIAAYSSDGRAQMNPCAMGACLPQVFFKSQDLAAIMKSKQVLDQDTELFTACRVRRVTELMNVRVPNILVWMGFKPVARLDLDGTRNRESNVLSPECVRHMYRAAWRGNTQVQFYNIKSVDLNTVCKVAEDERKDLSVEFAFASESRQKEIRDELSAISRTEVRGRKCEATPAAAASGSPQASR